MNTFMYYLYVVISALDANPVLKDGGFQSLALHHDGLYVAGKVMNSIPLFFPPSFLYNIV